MEVVRPGLTQKILKSGALRQFASLAELAEAYGIDRKSLDSTIARYNELLSAGVNPDAVEAACDSGKMARKPHAFFDRRAGGQALDPVSLNDIRTNTTGLTQSLCSGSRLVGCEERFSELGIETLSVVDVRTEAAEGEHNAASDADSFRFISEVRGTRP